ncbi:MAG: LLM class F420-dependent oxidoreductase [Gammaproteobacteria bacterium]|nr:LLM class F420-dependent oxidoreductase [Gammaproteobacteria bacterium]
MRIGTMLLKPPRSIEDLIGTARQVEAAGLDHLWISHIFGFDAISVMGIIGREVPRIRLGTSVTPTYPRHPTAIAQQALTTAAATKNRFTLGVGLSHQKIIENFLGLSFKRRSDHMREYLKILMPLARGEQVSFRGEEYNVDKFRLNVPGVQSMPVIIAALGSKMLALAGELADGTNTWMVGPKTMANHIVPGLRNPDSTVIGGIPIVLTNKVAEAREQIAKILKNYGEVPSYRAMLDKEGVLGPANIASVGDEITLRHDILRYKEAGVTDLNAYIMHTDPGASDRTLEFLSSLSLESV